MLCEHHRMAPLRIVPASGSTNQNCPSLPRETCLCYLGRSCRQFVASRTCRKMRFHQPYTLYGRRLSNGQRVWYYRISDPDGRRTSGRSTGQTSKALAHQVVIRLIQEGRLGQPAKEITVEQYSTNWWSDQCPYVQGRLMRGRTLTRKYIENQRAYLDNHILPTFGKMNSWRSAPRTLSGGFKHCGRAACQGQRSTTATPFCG